MSTPLYFLLWLVAALVAIGFLSAFIARHRRIRELRRAKAVLLLDAIERYCGWIATLRRAPSFLGESPEAAQALDEACTLRMGWFPELAGEMAEMLAVHNRLMNFLAAQDHLKLRDAEAWLESDHDGRFMALWKQQLYAVETMRDRLHQLGAAEAKAPGDGPVQVMNTKERRTA